MSINHLDLTKFCYNSTKHSTIEVNPFQLELKIKTNKFMDLIITRFGIDYYKGDKNVLYQKCHFMINTMKLQVDKRLKMT